MTGVTDNIKKEAIKVIMANKIGGDLPTKGIKVVKSSDFKAVDATIVIDTLSVSGEEYYITTNVG